MATALDRYVRLEALGLWREGPDAPAREVVVSFGKATLLLTDASEAPLGHWALAGLQEIGTRDGATVYAMTPDGAETLAIHDADMIRAIAEVRCELPPWPDLAAPPPRRRGWVGRALAVAVLAALVVYVPDVLTWLATAMVPPEQAEELGDRVLLALMEEGGALCADPAAQPVLDRIAAVALPEAAPRIRVLDLGLAQAVALPGGVVLVGRSAIGEKPDAARIAGLIAAAGLAENPVAVLMRVAGPWASLRQTLAGDPGAAAIGRAAVAIRSAPGPAPLPVHDLPPLSPAEEVALRDICG